LTLVAGQKSGQTHCHSLETVLALR